MERQEGMQRSVDGCGDSVFAERGQRIIAHHLVFVRFTVVDAFQLFEPVQIEQSETGLFDRSESPPLPFTASTRTGLPVNGSGKSIFELVLPPPKLVMRRSAPSRLER